MGSGMHIIRPHIGTEEAERRRRKEWDLNQEIITGEKRKTRRAYNEYIRQRKKKNPGKVKFLSIGTWTNRCYKEYHIRPRKGDEEREDLGFLPWWLLYSDEFRAIKKILLRRKENKPLTVKDRQAFRYLWSKGLMQGGEPGDKEGPIIPLTHPGRKRKVEENVSRLSNASGSIFAELYRFFAPGFGVDQENTYTIMYILELLGLKEKYEKDRRWERNNNIKMVIFPVVERAAGALGYTIKITVTNYRGEEIMVYPRGQKGKHYNLILGKVVFKKNQPMLRK